MMQRSLMKAGFYGFKSLYTYLISFAIMKGNNTRQGYAWANAPAPSNWRVTLLGGLYMSIPFDKPSTTYQQQLQLLESRGLIISDHATVEFYLKHIHYYRLGAYWLPFEEEHSTHQFKSGTSFQDILNLYTFDRELRLLLIDAIERFEVSVRAQWANRLSLAHGAHAHLNSSLARNDQQWQMDYDNLMGEVERSKEVFIQHFKVNYQEPLPPIWAVAEVMSLGTLSKWYKNLGPKPIRRSIADTYQIDESVLQSWLHHLVIVRNICAHHARIWNRDFTFLIQLPRHKPRYLVSEFIHRSRKLYNTLVLLLHCMDIISPQHHWRQRLIDLIHKHAIPVSAMGFPADWESRSIWQGPHP